MINQEDINMLIGGDELTFRKVYDSYSEKVYQLAFRFLKEENDSEEIVQETFLKLWVNREFLDNQGDIWLYLYVIAKRLCLNRLRKIRKSAEQFDNLMQRISAMENSLDIPIELKEMEEFIHIAIAKLPKQQQIIFNLSREEGLSHKEIAEKLGLSSNTVKNHMVQALKTLKISVQTAGYSSLLMILFHIMIAD